MRLRPGTLGCGMVLGLSVLWCAEASVFLAGPYDEEIECRSCNSLYLFRVRDLCLEKRPEPPTRDGVFGDEYDVPSRNEQLLASLFHIRDGSKELVWETYLPYPPRNCYVSNDGKYVVAVESRSWERAGDRGMQIFGPDGRLVQAYPRSYFDRVTNDPECVPGGRTITGPDSWHLHQYSGFTRDQKRFIVTLMQDEAVMYWNPKTGASVPEPPWPLPERLMVFDLETGKQVRGSGEGDPIFVNGMVAVWSDLLRSDDAEERLEGARGLAQHLECFRGVTITFCGIGGWEKHALPVIMDHLDDPDLRVRSAVLSAVARIDAQKALPFVQAAARAEEPALRLTAAGLLLSPYNPESFSLLCDLLRDPDPKVVSHARTRIWNMAPLHDRKGMELLTDYLAENVEPPGGVGDNCALLLRIAQGVVDLGENREQAEAAQQAAKAYAERLGLLGGPGDENR